MADLNLILTYVPESEHLSYDEALALAEERDRQAADAFKLSVPDSEKLSGPVLVTRMPDDAETLTFTPLRLAGKWRQSQPGYPPLDLPLDPRKTWGKILSTLRTVFHQVKNQKLRRRCTLKLAL